MNCDSSGCIPSLHECWLVDYRQDMVEARVRRLPGYVERVELVRQKGPAYRLRQYASKVLGDLHHPYQVNLAAVRLDCTPPVSTCYVQHAAIIVLFLAREGTLNLMIQSL